LFDFVKTGERKGRMLRKKTECVSRLSYLIMFWFDTSIHTVIKWSSSEASVNIAYRIETWGSGYAFLQRTQL